jgi:hypothetical protein
MPLKQCLGNRADRDAMASQPEKLDVEQREEPLDDEGEENQSGEPPGISGSHGSSSSTYISAISPEKDAGQSDEQGGPYPDVGSFGDAGDALPQRELRVVRRDRRLCGSAHGGSNLSRRRHL